MINKVVLDILACIISTFIVVFAIAGAIYLLGNIMIGWAWLAFDICFAFSGILVLVVLMLVMIILERKEGS